MTDKSLSEQICEVCGIEPLKDETAYFIGNVGKLPNFENNSNNFVKLLNLDFSPRFKSLLHYITSIFFSTNSTKDLLVQILHELKFDSQSDTVKQIKQAIRQADWEY